LILVFLETLHLLEGPEGPEIPEGPVFPVIQKTLEAQQVLHFPVILVLLPVQLDLLGLLGLQQDQ
jgi:hypothetical protein